MNKSLIGVITGLVMVILSVWLIVSAGFSGQEIDYGSVFSGLFFLIVGIFIIFNKKEDQIEEIKKDNFKK